MRYSTYITPMSTSAGTSSGGGTAVDGTGSSAVFAGGITSSVFCSSTFGFPGGFVLR
jgi:hypothetical protein